MCKVENFSWENFVQNAIFYITSDGKVTGLRYKKIYINKVKDNLFIHSQISQNFSLVIFLEQHKVLIDSILEAFQYGFWQLDFYRNLMFKGIHEKALKIAFQKGKSQD